MSDDKHVAILQVAIVLFVQNGFAKTTIDDITRKANVAKGTFYLYFRSKDDLVRQAFRHCHDMNVAACDEGLDAIPTAIGKLCRRMKNALCWAVHHPTEAALDLMYLRSPRYGDYGTRYHEQKHFASVNPIIEKGIAGGELKKLDPTLMGEVFFGVAGAYYHYVVGKPALLEDANFWAICEQTVIDCLSR